ncbi:MAG: class I SAM-dependent methyltransferase [Candidatus Micrarchaeota archaeon]|nr:class I SAM-dependent methyltransferase [Candidatus Micrarchaeota archaeon]
MTKETKRWWEETSAWYQAECKIPIAVHYGPGSPNEDKLRLLGSVKGKHILEIGCGGAQCSIAFAKMGAKVSAIDISTEQLKFAKKLADKNRVKIVFYQGDIRNLKQIRPGSQDVVFSAFALLYVDDLLKCFKEVRRVLKKSGLFVFSVDHPFHRILDSKKLKLKNSYFDTGKYVDAGVRADGSPYKFVTYYHTVSDLYNTLKKAGFEVESIIEPDSRKRYKTDPWYGLWDYTPRLLKLIPPTIIFKCIARSVR